MGKTNINLPITLSAIDERTQITALEKILRDNDNVEFAILLSEQTEGRHRYPYHRWIERTVDVLGNRCAIHVCGRLARKAVDMGAYRDLLWRVGRIQLNGVVTADEVRHAIIRYEKPVITQHMPGNESLVELNEPLHRLLVDGSAGKGVKPEAWCAPTTTKEVGFAGGLSAGNLGTELPKILDVMNAGAWIDMESSLRDADDWFDVNRALMVIAVARAHLPCGIPAERW